MGLLDRLRGEPRPPDPTAQAQAGLAGDARSMRATLDAMHAEGRGELDLRRNVRDLLGREVAAPTRDVASMRRQGVDADDFYANEIRPNWDGLGEAQRAARLEGFLDLLSMVDEAGDAAGLPEDMAARVRTKTLVLAWAFDETYGYLSRLTRDDPPAV
jgi:hypothetical protein